jgi:hypothetical protein
LSIQEYWHAFRSECTLWKLNLLFLYFRFDILKRLERQCMQHREHIDDILVWTHHADKHSRFSCCLRACQTGKNHAVTRSLTFWHRITHCNSTPYLEFTYRKQQKRNETVFSLCSYLSLSSIETSAALERYALVVMAGVLEATNILLCYELHSLLHYRGPGFCSFVYH